MFIAERRGADQVFTVLNPDMLDAVSFPGVFVAPRLSWAERLWCVEGDDGQLAQPVLIKVFALPFPHNRRAAAKVALAPPMLCPVGHTSRCL